MNIHTYYVLGGLLGIFVMMVNDFSLNAKAIRAQVVAQGVLLAIAIYTWR